MDISATKVGKTYKLTINEINDTKLFPFFSPIEKEKLENNIHLLNYTNNYNTFLFSTEKRFDLVNFNHVNGLLYIILNPRKFKLELESQFIKYKEIYSFIVLNEKIEIPIKYVFFKDNFHVTNSLYKAFSSNTSIELTKKDLKQIYSFVFVVQYIFLQKILLMDINHVSHVGYIIHASENAYKKELLPKDINKIVSNNINDMILLNFDFKKENILIDMNSFIPNYGIEIIQP